MATGVGNKLTGQIGEHLVSAKLGSLGYYASPYSGNVPGFDVTAVHSETFQSFLIQVKTSTTGSLVQSAIDKWCEHSLDADNYQKIGEPKELRHPNLVWVMVRLGKTGIEGCRYFICSELQIQEKIVTRYLSFMERHNFRRPGGGGSLQAILNINDLVEFEDNWSLIGV